VDPDEARVRLERAVPNYPESTRATVADVLKPK
jgi:hypothetical protein